MPYVDTHMHIDRTLDHWKSASESKGGFVAGTDAFTWEGFLATREVRAGAATAFLFLVLLFCDLPRKGCPALTVRCLLLPPALPLNRLRTPFVSSVGPAQP